jgi:uncharacterized protein
VTRYLIDTNIFVYARGMEHRYRQPCRDVLRAAGDGAVTLEASVEVAQEFTHLLLRRGVDRLAALEEAAELRDQCRLHAFDVEVWRGVTRLLAEHPHLGVRGAVHAATAAQAGIPAIISTDRVFDEVADLLRIDPLTHRERFRPGR